MLGEGCSCNCSFCAQARTSTAQGKFLSRIAWHEADFLTSVKAIVTAWQQGKIKRVCLQVVNTPASLKLVKKALQAFKKYPALPVVVSSNFASVEQATELFSLGAARLGLALDAATPKLFAQIKGGSFATRWQLLCACAEKFPQRITTHLIVGLGETELEMWQRLCACVAKQITVGLFAFTPLPGTPMAHFSAPDRSSYRRLQIGLELLRQGYGAEIVLCDNQRITGLALKNAAQLLANGQAFLTCGCADCNRPYYNDHPGHILYNYHRPLTAEELALAFKESGIIKESEQRANS